MKSSNFEVARDSPEMVPRCCPGAGASRLGRDGPAPPLSRAAGALAQVCRQTGRAKNRRGSGTGGTPGRIRTDHIVRHRGGEPPRAHRRAGRRGTRPRRQRGESSSRRHGSCNGGKKNTHNAALPALSKKNARNHQNALGCHHPLPEPRSLRHHRPWPRTRTPSRPSGSTS